MQSTASTVAQASSSVLERDLREEIWHLAKSREPVTFVLYPIDLKYKTEAHMILVASAMRVVVHFHYVTLFSQFENRRVLWCEMLDLT
jgi:hypothetical protein